LLAWFEKQARSLPWRSDPTPYKVWISEIMLQQTQVATVLPYFDRFLKVFPNVESLANADESKLMSLWEGLGYYRRARSMQFAAKQIVDQHRGEIPTKIEDVLALKGIGRYTAGAILSISGDQRHPILEGNTVRVFSRWIAMQTPPQQTKANALLWKVAESMLPKSGSGIFNQAAMELGALVCKPKQPACDLCPVRNQCRARQSGLETTIPGKVTQVQYESRREFALVIDRQRKNKNVEFLMRKCDSQERWAGLWDWPRPTDRHYQSVGEVAKSLESTLGCQIEVGIRLATLKHGVTKYRITLDVHRARASGDFGKLPDGWAWQTLDQIKLLALPVTARKIAVKISSETQPSLF
jgi:A/G-specific adenine glycosylase